MFCVNFIAVHNNRNRGETHHMFIIIIVSKYGTKFSLKGLTQFECSISVMSTNVCLFDEKWGF